MGRTRRTMAGVRLRPVVYLLCSSSSAVSWIERYVNCRHPPVSWGRFEAPTTRKNNVAIIFKRAQGHGRITRIEGLRELLAAHGEHLVEERLLSTTA
ncbi:MAG: hypothetical protein HYY06_10600 [Deltaproteobacteria bacterium]|nr:hypothetical protein [Deltaproteobacteria bacterium]